MKFLTPVIVFLIGLNVMAQYGQLDPARQAERDAVYGRPQDGGYVTPGNSGYYPTQPPQYDPYRPTRPERPPMPPPYPRPPMPPPPPYYGGQDYGPQYTVRWQDFGLNKAPKIISSTVSIRLGGQLVNEVLLRVQSNPVQISSAVAFLSNGQVVNLANLNGYIREGQELRSLLDYRFSMRVERIEMTITSPGLFGSLGQLQVLVGLAQ